MNELFHKKLKKGISRKLGARQNKIHLIGVPRIHRNLIPNFA